MSGARRCIATSDLDLIPGASAFAGIWLGQACRQSFANGLAVAIKNILCSLSSAVRKDALSPLVGSDWRGYEPIGNTLPRRGECQAELIAAD